MRKVKLLYTYTTMLHGQEVTVKRYDYVHPDKEDEPPEHYGEIPKRRKRRRKIFDTYDALTNPELLLEEDEYAQEETD